MSAKRFSHRIGGFLLSTDSRELESPTGRCRLEPLSHKLLLLLIEKDGLPASKDEIVDRLWGGKVVTADAINRQVRKLRSAFQDDPRNPQILQTIPKTGLRLVVPVEQLAPAAVTRTQLRVSKLAVLGLGIGLSIALFAYLSTRHPRELPFTQSRPLITSIGDDTEPALSPDGMWLAFSQITPSDRKYQLQVRRMSDISRSPPMKIAGGRRAAWSPDGRQLAFLWNSDKGCVVAIADRDLHAHPIVRCHTVTGGVTWLDEDTLIYSDQLSVGGPFTLRMVDIKNGSPKDLVVPPPNSIGDTDPVAASGHIVWFIRRLALGAARVASFSVTTGRTRELAGPVAILKGLAATKAGRLIVAAQREGIDGVWDIEPNTSKWMMLAPQNASGITISSDGGAAVIEMTTARATLWAVTPDGKRSWMVTQSTRFDRGPAVSANGKALAFISDRNGSDQIWVATQKDGFRALRFARAMYPVDVALSADGARIASSIQNGGNTDVMICDLGSGRVQLLATPQNERDATFSPDGTRIYFSRQSGAKWQIFQRSLRTGDEVVLQRGAMRPQVTNDGRSIVFLKQSTPGLWMLDLSSRTVSQISRSRTFSGLNWTVEGNHVWMLDSKRAVATMEDLRSGLIVQRVPTPQSWRNGGLAASASGVIYSRLEYADTDLYLLQR